jgi:hypothetical protein
MNFLRFFEFGEKALNIVARHPIDLAREPLDVRGVVTAALVPHLQRACTLQST